MIPKVMAQTRNVKAAKQRPWREVKAKMESERYTYLRRMNHENHTLRDDNEMRKEAEKYALDAVRSASRGAIAQDLGEA